MRTVNCRLSLLYPLALSALALSCAVDQALPAGSESFDPPPEYQLWWTMTEACSGAHGSFAAVDWYVVPGSADLPGTNGEYSGEWFENGNRIVVAASEQLDGPLVRHEMLHALVGGSGHPRSAFLERCAGIVVCADECMRDAGAPPAPPAGTPLVSPTALEIGVELQPTAPSATANGGYFALVVIAHNPANHAVVVQLPPYGGGNLGISFEYLIGTDSTNQVGTFDVAHDAEAKFFLPGETKREAFDLIIGSAFDGRLPPGHYIARGVFGDRDSEPVSLTLSP